MSSVFFTHAQCHIFFPNAKGIAFKVPIKSGMLLGNNENFLCTFQTAAKDGNQATHTECQHLPSPQAVSSLELNLKYSWVYKITC